MLLSHIELVATAPGGVAKLRELILTLAVQGKLVPQDPADEPASELLKKIRAEKDRLVAEGKIKRDKPLPPITEEEKPFALLVGWEWVRFGLLPFSAHTGLDRGRDLQNTEFAFPYFKMNNIANGGGSTFANMTRVDATAEEVAKFRLKVGDFLFNTRNSRELVGKTCVIDHLPEENTIFNNNILVSRFQGQLEAKFIDIWFRSPLGQAGLDRIKSATTNVCAIYQGNLFEFLCPIPPLAEQSRIVTRVEELMRLCDALEAKGQLEATQHAQLLNTLLGTLTASTTPEELADHWQRVAQHFDLLLDRPAAVDALEQTLLQLAVRGLLVPQDPSDEPASELLKKIRAEKDRLIAEGKIKRDKPLPPITEEEKPFALPGGWEAVRLGDYFFELCTGPFGSVIHKEDYVDGGVPLINPSHMVGGRISHDPSVSVSEEMSQQLSAYRLTTGDVVLARRGEVGRYALVTAAEDGWLCGTGSFFVKLHDLCNREFFGLVLEDPDLRHHLQGESVGSTMVNLNQRILVETPMALPPPAEQSRIVTRVAELRRLCADLRQRLTERQSVQAHLAEVLVASNSSK